MIKSNNRYLIKTQSGYKEFEGIRRTENTGLVITTTSSKENEIRCTEDHRILVGKNKSGKIYRKAKNLKINDKIKKSRIINIKKDNNKKFYYDPLNVSEGNNYLSSGITHHNCAIIDECVSEKETITVRDKTTGEIKTITVKELYEEYLEFMVDNKMINNTKYEVLTSEGFQDFAGIKRTLHDSSVTILFEDGTDIVVTEKHKFYVNGVFKYVEELTKGEYLSNKKIIDIIYNKHEDKFFYDLIEVENGHHYTTSGVESSNCAFIRPSIFYEFIDAFLPSQAALSWKKNIILSTPKGMNHFFDLVKGASPKYDTDGSGLKERGHNGYVLFKVDWRDVPRYDSKGNRIPPEEFMEKIINKHGILYWKQNFECIGGDSKVRVYDKFNKKYEIHNIINLKNIISEYITTDYTSRNYNSRYLIETINGYESFDNIISRGIKRTLLLRTENERIVVTYNHKFVVKNTTIFASDLKIGDYLETKNGLESIIEISENGEVEVFDILNTESHTYLANNINNHNCNFLGSSHTLISSEKLKSMGSMSPEEIRDGKLNIYHYPEKGHKYIMSVDAAKDGNDAFAIQIVDITDFKFIQVASAKLQIDYLLMPEYIYEWATFYNNAYLVIENNEGAGQSIADQMKITYEYENLHYDKRADSNSTNISKGTKKYPGFRTTTKSRKQILQTLKLFIENDNLFINDSNTISEFFQFVLVNGKYQADEGCHDDLIMSLALCFVPFLNINNFEDMKKVVSGLYSTEVSEEVFSDFMTLGSFDDGYEEDSSPKSYTWNGYVVEGDYQGFM